MTAAELIVALAQLPQDMEVVYDRTQEEDDGFRLEVVEQLDMIETDTGEQYIMINEGPKRN